MPGTIYGDVREGEDCIIYVNDVNHPEGWWFGKVVALRHAGNLPHALAHITSTFPEKAECPNREPYENYEVYQASPAVRVLVHRLVEEQRKHARDVHDLEVRLDEHRRAPGLRQLQERVERLERLERPEAGLLKGGLR